MQRKSGPAAQSVRSVDHSRGAQGGPAQQEIPIFGLTTQRRPIEKVVRGSNASRPIATYPDNIIAGSLPVMARSGNDDSEHQGDSELAGPDFSLVGDLSPQEIGAQKQNQMAGLAVGAAGFFLLAYLWK